MYPQYNTLARLQVQHTIENAHNAARQLDVSERWQQAYAVFQER
ncbi:hypothetical protein A2U01_0107095, partial [Trifolium medium]|nr:hypothetical protein [Trifolium medium]